MHNFVGYCAVELADTPSGVTFPMAVMYPTKTPAKLERLGPYSLDISIDAPPLEGVYPLIVISHGSGGSHFVYRTLAHYLSLNGFIVGMPEHPFNNRNNNTLQGTVENLINRPRHLRNAIDWFFESEKFSKFLKPDSVSIIGHSMGGYTALALAGGIPTSFPSESLDGQPQRINVLPDSRVTTLVLLAPGTVWFQADGALREVKVPILMLSAEKDPYTPYYHAQIVVDGVINKEKVQHRVVENAGHFSFLSPFPESMTRAAFLPSQDPQGFNRGDFHHDLNREVLAFLLQEA
jgi:predicted dienelactone hydrolase